MEVVEIASVQMTKKNNWMFNQYTLEGWNFKFNQEG
jgi:hypothetical protein